MFNSISLITNSDTAKVAETLDYLIDYLLQQNLYIELDECCARIATNKELPVVNETDFGANADLVIAIGGDGTMLKAAHLSCNHNIPLLGINRGRLGFLADIPAEEINQDLDEIFAGRFRKDERFLLHSEVYRDGKLLMAKNALNDVVLQKWNIARLVEFETWVDGTFVHRQRSDGIIVASPTGSTAYALSGGGPILYPSLDALVLVPICPHSLTNRPIVIHGESKVEIVVGTRDVDQARLTCDGDIAQELASGDRVCIQKKNQKIQLIHPVDHDYFSILRAKLRWG